MWPISDGTLRQKVVNNAGYDGALRQEVVNNGCGSEQGTGLINPA